MASFKHLIILSVILVGLAVSGCVSEPPAESAPDELPQQQASAADDALGEEDVGLTDTEIADLESDLAELEAMLEDLNMDEDLLLEEI